MSRSLFSLVLSAAFVPGALLAQAAPAGSAKATAASTGKPKPSFGAAAIRGSWQTVTAYIIRAAEQVPEADYAFKPTPEVRSFAELFGHLAGSQDMFCALALGEKAPAEDAIEKGTAGKAELVAALKRSTENCDRAYGQEDAALAVSTEVFGQTTNRMSVLGMNAVHNGEHYGNIVTYMRIKGMVPPSSQRGQ